MATQLFQVNRGMFISVNEEYKIQHIPYVGGDSEWLISRKNDSDKYFSAIAGAKTLVEAKAKYFEILKAVA